MSLSVLLLTSLVLGEMREEAVDDALGDEEDEDASDACPEGTKG